ncbi:MAG: hypothetical protein M3065_01195 [Actinomycetota bacterium]|nr:hypothetical protein [Actinomycetota bacterium]
MQPPLAIAATVILAIWSGSDRAASHWSSHGAADDHSEIVDGEPVLALALADGLPAGLPAELAAELADLLEDAERYAAAAKSINTSRAYASDWNQFTAWCERYTLEPLPASAAVVGLYI